MLILFLTCFHFILKSVRIFILCSKNEQKYQRIWMHFLSEKQWISNNAPVKAYSCEKACFQKNKLCIIY